jgi:antitoxin VapB
MMYIMDIYQRANGFRMTETATAKLFMHGRSQAVRLPKEFRLPGKEVRVRRIGRAVLLEPMGVPFDLNAWWAKIDEHGADFLPEGHPAQVPMTLTAEFDKQ